MHSHPRIAVISPFLDKRHGTTRRVTELVGRLAHTYGYEVHIYSQRVEDIDDVQIYRRLNGEGAGTIWWHRVPTMVGPGLLRYLWWFMLNHVLRWWDRWLHKLTFHMVYTPGVNCLDADVVSVHVIFARLYEQMKDELALRRNRLRFWPVVLHRLFYYQLITKLEGRVYTRANTAFMGISQKTMGDLAYFYGHPNNSYVVYHGINFQQFHHKVPHQFRVPARQALHLRDTDVVVLLVGNSWKSKGLHTLITALGNLNAPDIQLLVVGNDRVVPFQPLIEQYNLQSQIQFLPPRPDVEWYYAAADIYAGPSLEDAFALPPAEAMACGVPAIVSCWAGVKEIVTHGEDALILQDPTNAAELAELIQQLYENPELRQQMGRQAAITAQKYTWERNAAKMHMIFQQAILQKRKRSRYD
jgi:glycosyltransferase involved in cell wall biosynthesis